MESLFIYSVPAELDKKIGEVLLTIEPMSTAFGVWVGVLDDTTWLGIVMFSMLEVPEFVRGGVAKCIDGDGKENRPRRWQ